MDETTELCRYVILLHHWLESWAMPSLNRAIA